MLHENSNDDIDKYELRHQHEHDEKHRRDDGVDAAVSNTVVVRVTVVLQRVLHTNRRYFRLGTGARKPFFNRGRGQGQNFKFYHVT